MGWRANPQGVDGTVEAGAQHGPRLTLSAGWRALTVRPDATLSPEERRARAQAFSVLCHMSVLFGIPMFLWPMAKRDDAFGLHHGKASAINFLVFHLALIASVLINQWFFVAVLASYLPAWVGIWRAARGEKVGLFGFGPIGEVAFFMLKPKETPQPEALLEDQSQPRALLTSEGL